jgi:hypothetical protein
VREVVTVATLRNAEQSMPSRAIGTCRLTQTKGEFVRAHILPKAVTRPERPGAPLIQHGQGERPKKRFSSWYDSQLVTSAGENILRDYDTFGIEQLHQNKMVWSSWGPMTSLSTSDFKRLPGLSIGLRSIALVDGPRFRLFLLSLLWRMSETSLPEFKECKLPATDRERLRNMIVAGDAGPIEFYPTSLTQISTLGIPHNLAGLSQAVVYPGGLTSQIVRAYFDGLIVHFHKPGLRTQDAAALGPLVVGNEDRMTIATIDYESSWERSNLVANVMESMRDWPDRMQKLVAIERLLD